MKKLFSITYSQDKTHRVIQILGIKLKFKINKDKFLEQLADKISFCCALEISNALKIYNLHSKVFPQFKNVNVGKNVAVIGCGPSVKYYNSEINAVNIAVNDAVFFKNIDFDTLFVWDSNILNNTPDYLEKIYKLKCKKFIGHYIYPERIGSFGQLVYPPDANVYECYSSNRVAMHAYEYGEIIQPDISVNPLADFYTIAFGALHFAFWTNPDKIYLIGLDTSNTGHILGEDYKCIYNVEKMLLGYKKFKEFAKIHYPKTEIISVNPVGLKGLFKDVYTQSYVNAHPELLKENVEIINEEIINAK